MTMTRGAFSKLLAPGYRKVLFESYKERPIEGKTIVNTQTSKRAYEEEFPIAGFGTLLGKPEGAPVNYQDAVQGTAKRYSWSTYGLGFRVTQEMMEDDLYGVMGNRMAKALGRSARNNQEIVMHAPYNNAFNTAHSGFVAGEALCSTTHALIRGGTAANRPTVDADFALLSLQAALEHFHGLVDESGLPMVMIPKTVVYSVGDHWMVNQVLKSQHLPGGQQNDINQVANEGISAHLSHYMTDADAWFVLADMHDVNYFIRRPLAMSNTDDFETGDAKFKVTQRLGSGWSDWRGVYGSSGA
jgi:hypothetical protein